LSTSLNLAKFLLFTARRYASIVYAVVVCPSVHHTRGIISEWLIVESHKQCHTNLKTSLSFCSVTTQKWERIGAGLFTLLH